MIKALNKLLSYCCFTKTGVISFLLGIAMDIINNKFLNIGFLTFISSLFYIRGLLNLFPSMFINLTKYIDAKKVNSTTQLEKVIFFVVLGMLSVVTNRVLLMIICWGGIWTEIIFCFNKV